MGNTILAKGGNHILAKRDNSAWPKGSKLSGFSTYTEIPMIWNDAKRTLTIDARRGCYEGMLDERKFTVRMPDGSEKTVLYKGKKINVKF